MAHVTDLRPLNSVLVECAKLSADDRRARILQCVKEGRHDPDNLPFCVEPQKQELVRYCDQCWSVIDPHGGAWGLTPENYKTP
jgi:hypothetical protein